MKQPGGQHRNQDNQDNQRCQENIRAWQEGGRSIAVGNGRRVPEYPRADLRADDAGNEHLGKNPQSLETARHMLGCVITQLCSEYRHAAQIAGHHQEGADKHRYFHITINV